MKRSELKILINEIVTSSILELQHIDELFDQPYEYNVSYETFLKKIYKFTTEHGEHYEVEINRYFLREYIKYFVNREYDNDIYSLFKNLKYDFENEIFLVEFRKYTGNSYNDDNDARWSHIVSPTKTFAKVFSTVLKIIKDNIPENEIIAFSSKLKEISRVSLYDAMCRKLKRHNDLIRAMDMNGERSYFLIPQKI